MKQRDPKVHRQTDDSLGTGIEAGLALVVFAGLGFLLDRWLGVTPLLTILLFLIGAIGLFYKFRADYDLQIERLAQERRAGASSSRSASDEANR
jgi:F0F1-type ATP synthase assembly protein I